jgi:drug efflux transport system permease protein
MRWGRIYALLIKEILAVWQDPKSRAVLIVPAILQLVVFSFAATLDIKNVSVAVSDKDYGRYSYELIQRFVGSPTFSDIVFVKNLDEMQKVLDRQKAIMGIHFESDFSENIAAGRTAGLQVILDGRRSNASQIVLGYTNSVLAQFQEDILSERGSDGPVAVMVYRSWFNPNRDFIWFTVPNLIGILSMVIALLVTSLSVARERELGTFDQLLVSPLNPSEILVGKTLPALLIGVAEGTLIIFAAIFLFRVPFEGSYLMLYIGLTAFIMATVGVGLFISSMAKTQQQAILGVFVFMVPAVSLSGFATPVENMPDWLQTATLINPLRHFLVIVKGVFLKSMPFHAVFNSTWPLLVIGIVTFSSAAWFFRRRLE